MTQTATSRLEARVPTELYSLFQEAAAAEGLSLTNFLTVKLREAAFQTLEKQRVIRLSREDQVAFLNALLDPPPVSPALDRAMQRRRELLAR